MKKAVVIIFAVAVLGVLGMYFNNQDSSSLASDSSSNSSQSASQSDSELSNGKFKNGTFTGSLAETIYGPVKISVVINGGKITDVNFIELPHNESRSTQISKDAKPVLHQNTLKAQDSEIDFVTGATTTTWGYKESLQSALDEALKT
jgi:uncharacterized protein with FMN-binding domain